MGITEMLCVEFLVRFERYSPAERVEWVEAILQQRQNSH
jgi:hypothetical protein